MTEARIVRGPADVDYRFGNDDAAPRAARRALSTIVAPGAFADDVKLAASEMVTNVIRHTQNGGRMRVWGPDPVRVEVHDSSPILPERSPRRAEGGRGLQIVDAVSSNWGAQQTTDGKVVWAEFDPPS